jgi:hypothetical protein
MSSLNGVRIGAQRAPILRAPEYFKTYGNEVIDLMAEVGRPLDPWQALIQLDAFGVQTDGLWSAFELLVLLARQNGKGGATEAIEIGSLFLFREPLIMHSAHQFKTSTAAFRRIIDIIDASDWLRRRVKAVSRSKGDEGIELTRAAGGGRLQFVARTLGSGRGLTGSKTVFDEAAWLTIGQYAAQTPGLSTIPNPQIIYTTTPPDEDVGPMPEDAMLPSVRRRAHRGDDRVALHEWSPPKGYDRTDPEVHYACNPALGIRIAPWFLAKQLKAFTEAGKPEKFDTEHLGDWPPDADEQWQVVGKEAWDDAGDAEQKAVGGRALGISMAPDRSRTFVASFGKRADGLLVMQLVAQFPGSAKVVEWVAAAKDDESRPICAVVIGASDPARSLIPDLKEAGVDVLTPGTADVAAECGSVYDGVAGKDVEARNLRHRKQGPLTAAMAGTSKYKTGRAWIWNPDNDAPPLFAVTAASYGFRVSPPDEYDPLDNIL